MCPAQSVLTLRSVVALCTLASGRTTWALRSGSFESLRTRCTCLAIDTLAALESIDALRAISLHTLRTSFPRWPLETLCSEKPACPLGTVFTLAAARALNAKGALATLFCCGPTYSLGAGVTCFSIDALNTLKSVEALRTIASWSLGTLRANVTLESLQTLCSGVPIYALWPVCAVKALVADAALETYGALIALFCSSATYTLWSGLACFALVACDALESLCAISG